MNTSVTTSPGRQAHPPQPVPALDRRPARRVGLLDRAALHLGVALITWGRRPGRPDRRARSVVSAETAEAQQRLEALRNEFELRGQSLLRIR